MVQFCYLASMWDVNLTGKTPQDANTKDLVFYILSSHFPLSIAELTRKIKELCQIKLSYQAVRKAVNNLLDKGIVEKEDKQYRISSNWLTSTKHSIDQILLQYKLGTETKLKTSEDYSVYTITSLFEADNFWGAVLIEMAEAARIAGHTRITCYWHYAWWMVINLGRETQLFDRFNKLGFACKQFAFRDLPLNRWAKEIYREVGTEVEILENSNANEFTAFNIIGDRVIQVDYPREAVELMRTLFEASQHIQEISRNEISRFAHEPFEIKFTVFKNAALAENLENSLCGNNTDG